MQKWTYQLEKGASGYIHYQGRISLKNKTVNIAKLCPIKQMHWSQTSNENKDNDFYACKDETRLRDHGLIKTHYMYPDK